MPALAIWVLVFLVFAWLLLEPAIPMCRNSQCGSGRRLVRVHHRATHDGYQLDCYSLLMFGCTAGVVAAHCHHRLSRRIQARAHRALASRLETALYWLWFCLLLGLGIYLPYKLVWWIPDLQTIRQQAWSMSLRFLLAYVVGVTAFLAVVWMTAWHTDREDSL